MKTATLATILLLAPLALGQTRPYVSVGLTLMPSGYAALAYRGEAGVDSEARHFVGEFYGAYDNGRKTTDYTINNFRGHDRYLSGFAAFKLGNSFFGAGARWNQLLSSNYPENPGEVKVNFAEKSLHYTVGAGYDWNMARLEGKYLLPPRYECDAGSCSTPATHKTTGGEVALTFPSPARKGHLFWRQTVEFYHYDNVGGSGGGVTGSVQFDLRYRF